jgi:hypothetical protein
MGKCRFWLSYTNQRGTSTGASLSGGDGVHARGWDAGVKVTPRPRYRDEFDVYLTAGSHETGHDVHLGTVKDTPAGPAWEPAVKPGKTPADVMGMDVVAAIPVPVHKDSLDPDAYICAVHSGNWPSGEPYFAAVRAVRNPECTRWVASTNRYDLPEMSQSGAVHEMIRLAGCERPACTREHPTSRRTREEIDRDIDRIAFGAVPIDRNAHAEQEN